MSTISARSNRSPFRHNLNPKDIPVDCLAPLGHETRKHTKRQIRKLARSVEQFGFVLPILVDDRKRVVAGWGLVLAAKLLELREIPAIEISDLTEAELRALRLALNRLGEESEWDNAALKIEFEEILSLDPEINLELSGFEIGEIDLILGEENSDEEDEIPAVPDESEIRTKRGDLWLLGEHKILCADARDSGSYRKLLRDNKAQMVFTDAPYNVRIGGHVSGLGEVTHDEFAMASGEMSSEEFTEFLAEVIGNCCEASADGSIHFLCMDWRHMGEMLEAGLKHYREFKNLCVWNKSNAGMGSLYRSKHELVFVFKNGKAPHINNVELGRFGRYRTNVWDFAGQNAFGSRRDKLSLHPTVKPVAMIAEAIRDCSNINGLVLDPFGGSGSTLIAAERTGRKAALIELEPKYVDVTVKRWEILTGNKAVLFDVDARPAELPIRKPMPAGTEDADRSG
jgi:DNA modification methylase